jgi:AGZA family xanthine/uracil permease-like MFS transporter
MKPFVKGDIDGFLGLALDNVVQILIIIGLCQGVLGFDNALVYRTILPGVAVSFLVGNLLYARAALRLARETGRTDVCALPYGINTPIMIAYVFLIMRPAKELAIAAGAADPNRVAWQAGLVACFACGVIELSGSLVAERIRKLTPRVAMIATLGGIGLSFLALGFLLESFSRPIVGIVTLGVMFVLYFGRVRFGRGIPGIALAVAIGTGLSWLIGLAPVGTNPGAHIGLALPHPVLADLWHGLTGPHLLGSLSIILPMGFLGGLASLQNIESAEAAGDAYPVRPAMTINGLGTIAAACFGSAFPMSIYIGHPGWKAIGARAGYSTLNGLFVTVLCLTGTASLAAWAIPVDAGLAIIIWVGLVITVQAFQIVPSRHIIAVVVGLLPAFAAWGALLGKNALRAVGYGSTGGAIFSPALLETFRREKFYLEGAFALEQGFIYCALIWSAMTYFIVERQFARAAVWSVLAATLTLLGLMHSWKFTASDTVISVPLLDLAVGRDVVGGWAAIFPAWPFAVGYGLFTVLLLVAHRWAKPMLDHD